MAIELSAFKQLVDSSSAGIAATERDLTQMYLYVGLPIGSSFQTAAVKEALSQHIARAFTSPAELDRECKRLRRQLVSEHILEGRPLEPYYSALYAIVNSRRADGVGLEVGVGPDDWTAAVRHALDWRFLDGPSDFEIHRPVHVREINEAKAAASLVASGYNVERKDGLLYLHANDEGRLISAIEDRIRELGGVNFMRAIFRLISPKYDPHQERYRLTQTRAHTVPPSIPVGWLIQLGIKHFNAPGTLRDPTACNSSWKALLELATDYAAVMDLEDYSEYAFLALQNALPDFFIEQTQRIALRDSMFYFEQVRGSDVLKMMSGLLKPLDFDRTFGSSWTINQVLVVAGFFLRASQNTRGPLRFLLRDVVRACPSLTRAQVARVLDEVLAHPVAGANSLMTRVTEARQRGDRSGVAPGQDFFLRPLLRSEGQTFWLADRALCALSFLESLFNALRKEVGKGFDDQVGRSTEAFLADEFASKGINTATGEYADGPAGEVDLVVETDQQVVFFELKKKSMTRQARAGNGLELAIDLCNSMLYALKQACSHEIRLKKDGFLELAAGPAKVRVELRARAVECIAVSLMDFGAFQDRQFMMEFLKACLRIESIDGGDLLDRNRVAKVNELLGNFRRIDADLAELDPNERRPYFNCWFLSLPQLLVLLDGVSGPQSFRDSLWSTRHIVFGTFDFYNELAQAKALRSTAAALFEPNAP